MTVRASEVGCLQGRSRHSRSGRTELEPVSDAFGATEWRCGAMPGGRRFFRTFSFSASAECVPFVFGSSSGNRVPVPTGARIIIYYTKVSACGGMDRPIEIRCRISGTGRSEVVCAYAKNFAVRNFVSSCPGRSFCPGRVSGSGCLPCSEPLREAVPASLRRFRSASDGVSAGRIGRYPCRVICVLHEGERKPRPSWYVCLPRILRPDGMGRRSRDIIGRGFPVWHDGRKIGPCASGAGGAAEPDRRAACFESGRSASCRSDGRKRKRAAAFYAVALLPGAGLSGSTGFLRFGPLRPQAGKNAADETGTWTGCLA